jgi:dihydroneopterin aldolase
MKDTILIEELEAHFRVGVPDEERRQPQRLLISLELEKDFTQAARQDAVELTIDYDALTRSLLSWGQDRQWKLIETLACEIADWVLKAYQVERVRVEIKKYILPNTRHVGVRVERIQKPSDHPATT